MTKCAHSFKNSEAANEARPFPGKAKTPFCDGVFKTNGSTTRIYDRPPVSTFPLGISRNRLDALVAPATEGASMSAKGYVALHRDIRNHPRYREKYWFRVWAEMQMGAAHTGFKKIFKGKVIKVKPGQLITDRVSFGEELGIQPDEVERVWHRMKHEGEISWEAGNKERVITILDWDTRQMRTKCPPNDTRDFIGKSAQHDTASAQQTHSHPVIDKKGKKEEKDTFFQKETLPQEDYTPLASARRSNCGFEWGYVYGKEFLPHQRAIELATQNEEFLLTAKKAKRHVDGRIEEVQ